VQAGPYGTYRTIDSVGDLHIAQPLDVSEDDDAPEHILYRFHETNSLISEYFTKDDLTASARQASHAMIIRRSTLPRCPPPCQNPLVM